MQVCKYLLSVHSSFCRGCWITACISVSRTEARPILLLEGHCGKRKESDTAWGAACWGSSTCLSTRLAVLPPSVTGVNPDPVAAKAPTLGHTQHLHKSYGYLSKEGSWGWSDGSAVRVPASRGPRFSSQHPCHGAHNAYDPAQGLQHPILASDTHGIHTHLERYL